MSVGGHGNEITSFANGSVGDLLPGIAGGEHTLGLDTVRLERISDLLEILPILAHLLRFPEVQLPYVPRCPPVRDVNEHQRRPAMSGKLADVRENGVIVRGMLERHENALVHRGAAPR